MQLQVNRWGNSLAVRLPQELVRQLGVAEGDKLQADVLGPAKLALTMDEQTLQHRKAWIARLRELHKTMPETRPISKDELSRY